VSALPSLAAPAILLGRCDPYGAESGGPRRVMGGLHGPASAATPDMDLPLNVAQGEWICRQPAQVRVRMECRCGHKGSVMNLCSWHEEPSYVGEHVAGQFRRVKRINRVPGHFEEIQRRQAGACIRCLYPGKYAGWYHELFSWQGHLAALRDAGLWYTDQAENIRRKIEGMTQAFDEGNANGTIHRCPMRLVPVS
jgi:hypothetical protein